MEMGKLIRNLFVKWIIVLMIFYGGLLILADQIFAKGFSFHVLDVDQGLCVVLESEGHYKTFAENPVHPGCAGDECARQAFQAFFFFRPRAYFPE